MTYKTQLEKGCGKKIGSTSGYCGTLKHDKAREKNEKYKYNHCFKCRNQLEGYNQARKEELEFLNKILKTGVSLFNHKAVTERIKELEK